jgi:hypothetical protein
VTYFYYDSSSQSYLTYTPTAVSWNDYYETPSVDLYSYEPVTGEYTYA